MQIRQSNPVCYRHERGASLVARLLASLLLAWLVFCGMPAALAATPAHQEPVADTLPAGSLRALITTAPLSVATSQLDWALIRDFYEGRDFAPVWTDGNTLRNEAWFAIDRLARADEDGLFPDEYHVDEIYRGIGESVAVDSLELYLTDGLLRYIRHMRRGRLDPLTADTEWHIPPPAVDPVAELAGIVASPSIQDALQELIPRHSGYRRLRSLLQSLRSLGSMGGWPVVPPGASLERGAYDQRIHVLRHRLMLSGYLSGFDYRDTYHYDAELERAVREFQSAHGLEADGVVGRKTLAALNVPVNERIQQIQLNMERWRWMPDDLGERYLLVNMAGFELQAVENDETVMDMRVIIGRPYRSTPAFLGTMRYLVINPYWNVPHKLAILDLLPKQQADPDYLPGKGFRVYAGWGKDAPELDPGDIDWSSYTAENFPYRLIQDPGEVNSLGRIKFMLPNPYAVYLHDTPSRHLFNRPVRTFSSGCIRVAEPVRLANFVLNDGRDYMTPDVLEAISSGENQIVSLPRVVPVYMLYQTAWVDDEGMAHFRDDVYGRDFLVLRAWSSAAG
jgi:murein L,D-transpeptidase YcbB/YkuD